MGEGGGNIGSILVGVQVPSCDSHECHLEVYGFKTIDLLKERMVFPSNNSVSRELQRIPIMGKTLRSKRNPLVVIITGNNNIGLSLVKQRSRFHG